MIQDLSVTDVVAGLAMLGFGANKAYNFAFNGKENRGWRAVVATLRGHATIHRDILDELRAHNKESRKQYDDLRTRQEGQGRILAVIKDRSRGD